MGLKIKQTKYDKRFSKLIRARDVICQRCLKSDGQLECSHIQSRRHKSLRHDTGNAKLLCFLCHRWWHENPLDAVKWLVSVIGEDRHDRLMLLANAVKKNPTKFELDITYEEMKLEIEYLESVPERKRVNLQFRNRYK